MKKLIVAGVMALGFLSASAQTKIGYINTDEVIAAMPETEKANKELQEYQESLVKAGEDLEKEANDKIAQFQKDSATMTASMKEIKRGELVALVQRVQGYNNEAQEKAKQAAQQKFAPIQVKAMDAIKSVAKKNGYAYVLDINSVLVGPPGDDILPLVKKELGIKETAAPAQTPAGQSAPVKTAPATKPPVKTGGN
jgi:outer membrane protein